MADDVDMNDIGEHSNLMRIRNSMYKSNMRKIGRLRDDSNMNQEISFVSVRISLSFLVVCVCVEFLISHEMYHRNY